MLKAVWVWLTRTPVYWVEHEPGDHHPFSVNRRKGWFACHFVSSFKTMEEALDEIDRYRGKDKLVRCYNKQLRRDHVSGLLD
jgi:ferric-dicitrate binding protein FerR (iron transport regulator)